MLNGCFQFVKCLELAAQQVDFNGYELRGWQSFVRPVH